MSEPLALAIAIAAIALLSWTAVSYARYRAIYRYSDDDLDAARTDAAKRSRAVRAGKATEQLVPLTGPFPFDPQDARFLGAPVDYVIFDGLAEGTLEEIVLLEVKTGSSRLNQNEAEVKRAVREGRVRYELLRLN